MEPTPMTAPKQPTRPASEQAVSDEDVKHGAYDNAGLCYGCGSRKGSAHRERRGGWPCRVELLLAECLRARKAERDNANEAARHKAVRDRIVNRYADASEQAVSDEELRDVSWQRLSMSQCRDALVCCACGQTTSEGHESDCPIGTLLTEALRARKAERAAVAWQRSMLDELHGILPPSMTWDGEPKRLAELLSMDGGKADRLAAAERVVDKAATEHCYNRPNALCGKCAACLAREYRR